MKNIWYLIEIDVPGAVVEIATAVLTEYECQGTVVEDRTLDTFVVPDEDLDLEQIYCLKAYFQKPGNLSALQTAIHDAFVSIPALVPYAERIRLAGEVKTEDWAQSWKQNFSSFAIGEKLVFKPSWEELSAAESRTVIEIDPGMAFGTGTHGTTRLCLEMIAEMFAANSPPQQVLDVGTGSGILALGAAALGCQKILANDIDPLACSVARENIANNGYSQQISVTEDPLEKLSGRFDLVVANILAEENVRLRHALLDHMNDPGWLVLSGILREKEHFVREGFADLPLSLQTVRYQDDWVCLAYQRV